MISDREYLQRVRGLECSSCGKAGPSQAHHVDQGGVGMKGPDTSTIPLCHACHARLEDIGHRRAEVEMKFSVAMALAETLSRICFDRKIRFPSDLMREVFK